MRRQVYMYMCDHPGCDEYDLGTYGRVRSRPGAGARKHWCLEHYPYDRCSHCAHIMRPSGAKRHMWPGTRAKGGGGLCSTCYLYRRNYGKLPTLQGLTEAREVRRLIGQPHHEGEGDWQLGGNDD